jgi:hypothetical protein
MQEIDHENGDFLDNTRENLRHALKNEENAKKKNKTRITVAAKEHEEIDQLFVDVTTKGEKILPRDRKKYSGCVKKSGNAWVSRFACKAYKEGEKRHKTMEDADAYVKEVTERENLKIRNIIYKYKNDYYCVLTQKKLMIFSFEDLELVEKYTWYAGERNSNIFYAFANKMQNEEDEDDDDEEEDDDDEEEDDDDTGKHTPRNRPFHQLVLGDIAENETVDHRNQNGLDNRRGNLRPANERTQHINRREDSRNKIRVITGVYSVKNGSQYRAGWVDNDGNYRTKSFAVPIHKEDALNKANEHRKYMERTIPHYKMALERSDDL